MITKQSAELRDWTRRGAEHAVLNRRRLNRRSQLFARRFRKLLGRRLAFAADDKANQRRKRRIEVGLPAGQLGGSKAGIVMVDGSLNRVVIGRKSLDQDASPFVTTACTAGNLGHKLERPLRSPDIAKMKRR